MAIFGLIGWTLFIASSIFAYLDRRYFKATLEQKDNAISLWRNQFKGSCAMVDARDKAIAHMSMEIEALTPKRSAHGRFVSKKSPGLYGEQM